MVKLDVDGERSKPQSLTGLPIAPDAALKPRSIWVPENEDQLISNIASQTAPIRVIKGRDLSRPSFGLTSGTAISLERLSGLVTIDPVAKTATFWAGTLLSDVHKILSDRDLALISSPDSRDKTLGEAVAFADHGSGRLGCLSAYVKSMRLISPQGKRHDCDATVNPSLFQAARVDLGLLGVASQITLYIRDRYRLKESIKVIPFDQFIASLTDTKQTCRHEECWVFPWASEVVVRQLEETLEPLAELDSNWTTDDWFLKWMAWLNQYVPNDHLPWLKRLKWLVPHTQRIGWAHDIIPKPHACSSYDLEYSVSIKESRSVILGLLKVFREMKRAPMCSLHVRWVARDDIWLSPFYGSDKLSVSLSSGGASDDVVREAECVFIAHGCRSTWFGHLMNARRCADLYPRWVDFLMIRQSLDPHNKMVSAGLKGLFLGSEA